MNNIIKIVLDDKIYNLEAILNTCYSFIDCTYIFLDCDHHKKGKIVVSLKEKKKLSSNKIKQLEGEFMNELLHNALRYRISKNNKKIREYIIGRALYSDLSSSDLSFLNGNKESDYKEDPLGIAIPWEDKYGKNKNINKNKKNAKVKV